MLRRTHIVYPRRILSIPEEKLVLTEKQRVCPKNGVHSGTKEYEMQVR
jgi:hypothetical protein